MRRAGSILFVALLAFSGCDSTEKQPVAPMRTPSPSAPGPSGDTPTLKVDAPSLVLPADGATVTAALPFVVTVTNVRGLFGDFPVTYEIEIQNAEGAVLSQRKFAASGSTGTTKYTVPDLLEANKPLTWRVRATFNDAAGPWSATRTVVLRVFSTVIGRLSAADSQGDAVDIASGPVQLRAFFQMQGTDVDCTDRAGWSVSDPTRASVSSGGLLKPLRVGRVTVTASCNGAPTQRAIEIVPEIWLGVLSVEQCDLVTGTGPRCWRDEVAPGRSLPFTLVIADSGSAAPGRLNLQANMPGFLFLVTAQTGSQGALVVDGTARFVEDCTFDIHDFIVKLHMIAGRFTLELSEFPIECRPHGAPSAVWLISGRVDGLHR